MDFDKIYERIMLLKLIQSSGVETPYEMDLDLVGEVLLGKNYKITPPAFSAWETGAIANAFATVKIEPPVIPNIFFSGLKSFIMFFRKNNDLHLVHIRSKSINAVSFEIMQKIGARRIYYHISDDEVHLFSPDFYCIENIYYHPVITLRKANLTFQDFVSNMCYSRNRVADLIGRSRNV